MALSYLRAFTGVQRFETVLRFMGVRERAPICSLFAALEACADSASAAGDIEFVSDIGVARKAYATALKVSVRQ